MGSIANTTAQLTPFVAESFAKTRQTEAGHEPYEKRFTGADYLKAWKLAGGYDAVDMGGEVTSHRNMPEPFEEKAAKS